MAVPLNLNKKTHTETLTKIDTHTCTHTLSKTYTHARTHSHKYTYTHKLSHTHTHLYKVEAGQQRHAVFGWFLLRLVFG